MSNVLSSTLEQMCLVFDLLGDNVAVGRLQSLVVVGYVAGHCKAELLIKAKRLAVRRLHVQENLTHLRAALSVLQESLQQATT